MPPSRFTPIPDAWDIVLATDDDDDPLTLMLVRDDDVALWEGVDAPALSSDQPVYREQAIQWRPTLGAGYSRRTPDTTSVGPDGQIVSNGTSYGLNATFVVPGIAMPSGEVTQVPAYGLVGEITKMVEYGGVLYITTGTQYLLTVTDSTDLLDIIPFGPGFTTLDLQVFDGKLYVSGGSSGSLREFDGTTWVACANPCQAVKMERVNWTPSAAIMGGTGGGSPADHLILSTTNGSGFYHVVSGNDVKVFANWIGPISVGDSAYPIQQIVATPHVVYFSKANGLHGFTDTGRAPNLTPWAERVYNAHNGEAVAFYSDDQQALVFYGHQFGLVAVTLNGTRQDTARFVQFGARTANETPIWGRPRAIAPYVDGLFVAYWDGATSHLMRLIFEAGGGYRWSGDEWTLPGQMITYLKVASPNGKPRLWIGSVGVGTPPPPYLAGQAYLSWQSLPTSGNPWVDFENGDTGHRYSTFWHAHIPREDGGSSAEKVVRRYDLTARGIGGDSGNYVTLYASADDGVEVEQGSVTEGARASFLANTYQSGTWFNWHLVAINSATDPVVLETFQARMSVLPEQADVWTFRCQLAAGQGIGNDAEDIQDPYTVRARLRAFQRAGPIQMRRSPLSRETLTVKVEQGARLQSVKTRRDDETILVVTFTVSVLASGAIYNADVYGSAEYGDES